MVAGVAATGVTATAEAQETQPCRVLPARWGERYDVVVAGSGYTGLAATYEAYKAG
jgi:NADPH-dependent 2,4-dienoyl-CoA reductase/sulfur reductase-like enzyme